MLECLDVAEHRDRQPRRLLARGRELDAPAARLVELGAKVILEPVHALRDGSLGDAEFNTGARQAAVLDHREETTQGLEVHDLESIARHAHPLCVNGWSIGATVRRVERAARLGGHKLYPVVRPASG